jgi:hypothetical protein
MTFFDVKTMRATQETKVKGRIYGISSYDGKTIVVCRGSGMLLLDEEGEVDTDSTIRQKNSSSYRGISV